MSLVSSCLGSILAFGGRILASFFNCSSATPLTEGLGEPRRVSTRNPSRLGSWKKPFMLCVRNCRQVVRRSKASEAIKASTSSTVRGCFFRSPPDEMSETAPATPADELSDNDISLPVELPVELSRLLRVASILMGCRLFSAFWEPEEASNWRSPAPAAQDTPMRQVTISKKSASDIFCITRQALMVTVV